MLSAFLAVAYAEPLRPGVPYYSDEFKPAGTPWQPPAEKNIEEVFKNYYYYKLMLSDKGIISVTHFERGKEQNTVLYRKLKNGSLEAVNTPPVATKKTSAQTGQILYQINCAACHGDDRLGITGPALLPDNLGRLKPGQATQVISEGRPATQMPAFTDKLSTSQIDSIVEFIYSPPDDSPSWDEAAIKNSHMVYHAPGSLPGKPVFAADPLNLFVVVESGDHHITILDGDRFEPIHRFETRFALHGGPKYSTDGRYVYMASRDGWISKFDLYNLKLIAEIRAGINTRNLAISADNHYVMVGNTLPHTLVLLDAEDLKPIRIIPVLDEAGRSSRVSAVYQAAPRNSFIAALKDAPEVWEIRVDNPDFPLHRIPVQEVLDDFFFDPEYRFLIGAARHSNKGQVLNLDSGQVVADIDLPGMPHLGSGIVWDYQGKPVMATPNLKDGEVSVIDMSDWKVIERIKTDGPGFFMRSHENSPYAWVDVFFGPHKDAMHVIDKQTLKIVKTLYPEKGKTSGHVEFTRDGSRALVSLWEMDGALVIYDAKTLKEIKRVPMKKPSGKYNVYNKIHLSAGTSH